MSQDEFEQLGTFDLIWCLGVLYQNVEQLRLLRKLFHLSRPEAMVLVESATTRDRRLAGLNVVAIHWPQPYRETPTITHLPSRTALKSWLEMVGFAEVRLHDVYARALAWQRAVVSAVRPRDPSPYVDYEDPRQPTYVAGDAS